jgi:diketogulonate reductase-like aldo/keto reductase
MTPRLTLGTANFGLAYGIANKRMLTEKEAFAILEKAVEVGVSSVDTARGYGDAEKVLGKFFLQHGKVFEVVSKLQDGEYHTLVSTGSMHCFCIVSGLSNASKMFCFPFLRAISRPV